MSSDIRVKICGLRTPADVAAVAAAGGQYVGFVFFPKSPRNIMMADAAKLAAHVPVGIAKVGLVVDPTDDFLDELLSIVPLDMIQLHGSEPPARVSEVKARTGLPVMKAVGIAGPDDLAKLDAYGAVADQLLVDTKPPKDAAHPGGLGQTFDWTLIKGRRWPVPWMLAGGLTVDNIAEAIAITGARQVDLSSGVESAPGVKVPALIAAFCEAALTAR
jgi:phosphoribosylanthranilate isomerase